VIAVGLTPDVDYAEVSGKEGEASPDDERIGWQARYVMNRAAERALANALTK
jgi:hypothetical protein